MPPLSPLRWSQRLPAHLVNGIAVALGIALIQLLFGSLIGPHLAQLVVSGAIFASLADLPNTVQRGWRHVLAAGLLGSAAALAIAWLSAWPALLGAAIAIIVFAAMLGLAWGPRAGPITFTAVLAIVFTMGHPSGETAPLQMAGWHLLGALSYLLWAIGVTALLQRRYRSLALAAALRATALLLRSRAGALQEVATASAVGAMLPAWIRDEASLAERLQIARDLLFAAPDTPRARRETAALLRAIDLRDILLASRLDLELLGTDLAARQVRSAVAQRLQELARSLDAADERLRGGLPSAALADGSNELTDRLAGIALAADDARARLLPALADRLRHLGDDVARIHALLAGQTAELPLSTEELQLFVAPEGWPLSALRAHASLASPVLRHALRAGLALGAAYYIALALPWASHPQWLVLSVAVVLRGNLEQTLARRNSRVLGTVLGCVIVMGLAQLPSGPALLLVFLSAVGIAHSFAVERYLVTAAAATVMALLQAHLAQPATGFAVLERLADTLLGALLAWGFSYVLPSWERRSLPLAVERALQALRDYARQSLRQDASAAVAQRLARRRAYDTLSALATALQRSSAEPARVRLPMRELAALLDHGQRLMAHLSMVRLMLARRSAELDRPEAADALRRADAELQAALNLESTATTATPVQDDVEVPGLALLPERPPTQDILPWLLRRLRVSVHDGNRVASAARTALALLGRPAGRKMPDDPGAAGLNARAEENIENKH